MSALPRSPAPLPSSPALRSFEAQWLSRDVGPLSSVRARAMQRVLSLGLPSTRDESWRYTNLRHVTSIAYVDAPLASPAAMAPLDVSLVSASERAATVVLMNGCPLIDSMGKLPDGLTIRSLKDLSRSDPDKINGFMEPVSEAEAAGEHARWALLNTALFIDGVYVCIAAPLAAPVVILHVLTGVSSTVAYPRVIIDVLPGASATVIEHYVNQGTESPLCNSATHIAAGRDSRVEHYRVYATGDDATHIDSLRVRQEGHSHCKQFTVALGGGLVRSSLDADLSEPGASLDSFSLLVGAESRHVDCVNVVTHDARDTRSTQTARAIAGGKSRVVFNSKVVVNAGAVRADSKQSCRGLLLSPTAEIDTRPQLEIYADEVKCAHGATVGRLDPDMLFYLLSRGIDHATAQSLLVYAFLADVLTGMSIASARSAIESALISQLPDSQILNKFR